MELAAHMRHAGGLDDLVAVELLVTPIAIGMHHAAEVCEVVSRMHALSVRAIVVGDCSRSGILITAAIEDIDPDPAGFCLAPSGVEHIDGGIVRMYSVKRGDMGPDSKDERRSEEHTSELQSLMRISYAVIFLKNK